MECNTEMEWSKKLIKNEKRWRATTNIYAITKLEYVPIYLYGAKEKSPT